MADMNSRPMRLLGVAQATGATALRAALDAVPGPSVLAEAGAGWVAFLQPEKAGLSFLRGQKSVLGSLHLIQRRLEIACQAGPFLAADPAAAVAPQSALRALLRGADDGIAAALAQWGRRQQWDVIVKWPAEAVLTACRPVLAEAAGRGQAALAEAVAAALRADRDRREAVLLAALRPAVLECAPGGAAGAETEIGLTVAVPPGGEAAIERALERIDGAAMVGAGVDMRGPLPALSFAVLRIASTEPGDVAQAWTLLNLPEFVDPASLHQAWRRAASAAHPDRAGAEAGGDGVSAATSAYHLLRGLLHQSGTAPRTLRQVLRSAGHRLVLPPVPAESVRALETL